MYTTLKLTFEAKVATLTLSRAEKRNAICHALIDEFLAALNEVEHSPAQVLIVAAEGKAFCAGMDLEDLQALVTHRAEENHAHSRRIATLFRSLYDFPKTTIAAVNGAAIAGGAALATLCDFTLASAAASFGYTEVRIGFVPAVVSSFLLRQVGEKHARDLLLSGRVITAEEAYRMGLVNEVVQAMDLQAVAQRLAEQLLENSPASLRATKALLRSYTRDALDREIEGGMEVNASIRKSADFEEGVRSFLERRNPRWSE
jgi:methylglutaconyl-CoA hydratase